MQGRTDGRVPPSRFVRGALGDQELATARGECRRLGKPHPAKRKEPQQNEMNQRNQQFLEPGSGFLVRETAEQADGTRVISSTIRARAFWRRRTSASSQISRSSAPVATGHGKHVVCRTSHRGAAGGHQPEATIPVRDFGDDAPCPPTNGRRARSFEFDSMTGQDRLHRVANCGLFVLAGINTEMGAARGVAWSWRRRANPEIPGERDGWKTRK